MSAQLSARFMSETTGSLHIIQLRHGILSLAVDKPEIFISSCDRWQCMSKKFLYVIMQLHNFLILRVYFYYDHVDDTNKLTTDNLPRTEVLLTGQLKCTENVTKKQSNNL